VEAWKQKKLGN